jgi:protoporphyrinogen oxidase
MAAFGASHRLRQEGRPHVVFDMHSAFGGHTKTHVDELGFAFDEGPHVSFTKDARLQALFAANINGEYEVIKTQVNNYWGGHWIKHPAQCNLHGLPIDLVVQILTEMAQLPTQTETPPNYEAWLVASYGRTFASQFPMRYGKKYHTTDASNMSIDWLGPRLYRPSLPEVFRGALAPETPDVHYVQEFRYPTRGGFNAYLRPFAEGIDLRLDHRLTRLDPASRTLSFANGASFEYSDVISSIPLPELIKLIPSVPTAVKAAAERLACSTCVVVNLGIDREEISPWHWTYFYDEDIFFTRVSYPRLLSPNNTPPGTGSIQVEVYFSKKYKPLQRSAESCIEPVIADLRRVGLLRDTDRILCKHALLVEYANIIFDLDRAASLGTVHGYLDEIGVRYCGRYGEWGYQWTDESFLSGEKAAQTVLDAMTTR